MTVRMTPRQWFCRHLVNGTIDTTSMVVGHIVNGRPLCNVKFTVSTIDTTSMVRWGGTLVNFHAIGCRLTLFSLFAAARSDNYQFVWWNLLDSPRNRSNRKLGITGQTSVAREGVPILIGSRGDSEKNKPCGSSRFGMVANVVDVLVAHCEPPAESSSFIDLKNSWVCCCTAIICAESDSSLANS